VAKKAKSEKPRQELLKIEKKIFRQNQETIDESVLVSDKDFKKYLANYKRAVRNFTRRSTVEAIHRDISKSRIVLVGDYHTLDQSQRSFVRVLRNYFRDQNKKVIVALEAIQARHQRYLNQFMFDGIKENVFIEKIGFKEHWFFDLWENHLVIFDFLKFHQIQVYGIEAPGYENKSLLERDEYMAEQIVDLADKNPDKKIFVLVGDLHLSPQHLPKQIHKFAKKKELKLPIVTLYQNSAEIYWKLSEKELVDHTLIVKVADKSYCRMHTPPIIVQQSYLNWLYHEEGIFDWVDAKASFLNLVERISHVIGLKLPEDYETVEVYTCGDLGFMKLLSKEKTFSKKDLKFIRRQIENSESYFLPGPRIAYIANVSIHHAAEEASHYLKSLHSGLEFPRPHKDAFYANVLHEAIGFFGSKLINSKRKCARYKDFISQKKYLERSGLAAKRHLEYETADLFIKHTKLLKTKQLLHTNKIVNLTSELFLALSHALGYDLGDGLYYGFMDGKINKEFIRDLFTNPFAEEGKPGEIYLQLIKLLKGVKRPPKL